MMMDCIIRRKRLLTIILLTVFVALGARAQDDEDIARGVSAETGAGTCQTAKGSHEVAEIYGDLPGGEGYGSD